MLVVDASCLYEVLVSGHSAASTRARLAADDDHLAPAVIDAEVLGVIRRDLMLGRLDPTAADLAVADLHDWPGDRIGHRPLLARAWEMRNTVRTWDALYVALAEAMDAPLLTLDSRLAAAPGIRCSIEVVSSD